MTDQTTLKILARKNLRMSPGKLAAQAVHAALMLNPVNPSIPVVVLTVTDRTFRHAKKRPDAVIVRDAGFTEVSPGTETVLGFLEDGRQDAGRGRSPDELCDALPATGRE